VVALSDNKQGVPLPKARKGGRATRMQSNFQWFRPSAKGENGGGDPNADLKAIEEELYSGRASHACDPKTRARSRLSFTHVDAG